MKSKSFKAKVGMLLFVIVLSIGYYFVGFANKIVIEDECQNKCAIATEKGVNPLVEDPDEYYRV